MRNLVILCCAIAVGLSASAQEHVQVNQQLQRNGSANPVVSKTKPLTKEDQLRVRQLLENAEAGAAALDAASRVVSYAELAHAYQLIDSKKAVELLESGIAATRDLQLESADRNLNEQLKRELQRRVVQDFAKVAPERLDRLMEQLPTDTRALALQSLMPYYGKTQMLGRALDMVMSVAQADEMPYESAAALMTILGHDRANDVRSLFVSSLASYQSHEHPRLGMPGDFPDLVAKFSDQLSQAKKNGRKERNV